MEKIKKQNNIPTDWKSYFIGNGIEVQNYSKVTDTEKLKEVRQLLINEQEGLCAYCQRVIEVENSNIEHIIPKAIAPDISTNYFNLVAVCNFKDSSVSNENELCENNKKDKIIKSFVYFENLFEKFKLKPKLIELSYQGYLTPNKTKIGSLESELEILNLNDPYFCQARAKAFDAFERTFLDIRRTKVMLPEEYYKNRSSQTLNYRGFVLALFKLKYKI